MTNEQLVTFIRAGENVAENMLCLWEQNKNFIGMLAMKYKGYAELEDLKQEGYIGLYDAVSHYDLKQNVTFITYATFWIKQRMRRYISNCSNVLRIPEHARNNVQQYNKIKNEYLKWYGKEPTDGEMADFLGISMEKLEIIKKNVVLINVRSFSEPVGGEDESITLSDTLASGEDMEEYVIKKLDTAAMEQSLWRAVEELPDNCPKVIQYRYQYGMTLKEFGQSLGIATEKVRQIEAKGLRTLRIRRNTPFQKYYEQYIEIPVHHVGIREFNRTWFSEVELAALGWKDYGW